MATICASSFTFSDSSPSKLESKDETGALRVFRVRSVSSSLLLERFRSLEKSDSLFLTPELMSQYCKLVSYSDHCLVDRSLQHWTCFSVIEKRGWILGCLSLEQKP